MSPVRATRRSNPLLPWAAGAVLSLVVLALTLVDERWLDRVVDLPPLAPEPPAVTVPLERTTLPAPEPAAVAAVPLERTTSPAPEPPAVAVPLERTAPDVARVGSEPELAPFAKLPPKIVPISPDGRGTARLGPRPEPSSGSPEPSTQDRSVVPVLPDGSAPRVVPISLERPQASLSPGVQLVGAVAAERGAGADLADRGRASAADAPAASDLAGVRLFIHYGAAEASDAAVATRLAEYLRRRGFEVAGIRPVDFLIERPGVRFFFERDHAESERLLEDLGWFFRGQARQAPERASDFTHYTPKPQPGTIEIWLPTTS